MFFHVCIELTASFWDQEQPRQYALDYTDIEQIKESFVIPYLQEKPLRINGYILGPAKITRFLVKSSKFPLKNPIGNNPSTLDSLFNNDKITSDVTDSIIYEAESSMRSRVAQGNETLSKEKMEFDLDKTKVFIVHGRDNQVKTEVARFVERFGFTAIILHEQPSSGKTIIEKSKNIQMLDLQ